MLLGVCHHCGSVESRYYDEDEKRYTKQRELKCVVCGSIRQYVSPRGRVTRAGIPPTEAQRRQAEAEMWERLARHAA